MKPYHSDSDQSMFYKSSYLIENICRAEMASYSKVVTGLTGMNVAKNPTHTLGVLYRSARAPVN